MVNINKETFVISDLHLGHGTLVEAGYRPAGCDELIMDNWNSVVRRDDWVMVLGDASFANREQTTKYVAKLKGHKALILGNHDKARSKTWWTECGFYVIPNAYKNVMVLEWARQIIFTHEPMHYLPPHFYNIHGHIHNMVPRDYSLTERHINVCCEALDYTPIRIGALFEKVYGATNVTP